MTQGFPLLSPSNWLSTTLSRVLRPYKVRGCGRSRDVVTQQTTSAAPELRWPNEGFISTSLNKKSSYNGLTLAQWVSGQLNNVTQIEDTGTLQEVLNQVALAVRDAVSIPWPAVRGA